MIICPNCSEENSDDGEFCIHCGGPLRNIESNSEQHEDELDFMEEDNGKSELKRKSSISLGMVVSGFFFIISLSILVIILLDGDVFRTGRGLQEEPLLEGGEFAEPPLSESSGDSGKDDSLGTVERQSSPDEVDMIVPNTDDERDIQIRLASELYGDIIDRYRYGIEHGWTNTTNISQYVYDNADLKLSDVGFLVIDINGDGAKELLISFVNDAETNGRIIDVYGHDGSKPVWLMGSSDWWDCYLHEDGDIYTICDNSFGISRFLYSIEGDKIKEERRMILSYNEGTYYYDHDKVINYHGYMESGISITNREEYERLLEDYDGKIRKYSVISLDNTEPTMTEEENKRLFMTKYLEPLYAEVLDQIIGSSVLEMSEEELYNAGRSFLWTEGEMGYMLRDLDMDGVSELLIGLCGRHLSYEQADYEGTGIAIYTIETYAESGSVLITKYKEYKRNHFYLLTGNIIQFRGTEEWYAYYSSLDGKDDTYYATTTEDYIVDEYFPLAQYKAYVEKLSVS